MLCIYVLARGGTPEMRLGLRYQDLRLSEDLSKIISLPWKVRNSQSPSWHVASERVRSKSLDTKGSKPSVSATEQCSIRSRLSSHCKSSQGLLHLATRAMLRPIVESVVVH